MFEDPRKKLKNISLAAPLRAPLDRVYSKVLRITGNGKKNRFGTKNTST